MCGWYQTIVTKTRDRAGDRRGFVHAIGFYLHAIFMYPETIETMKQKKKKNFKLQITGYQDYMHRGEGLNICQ
jgi:FMN phosphatase YigB (HAD superfamily)